MVIDLLVQLGLDGLEEVLIDNGRLLTFEDFALEGDLTDIASRELKSCSSPWSVETRV
jgi:hypothetical protein